MRILTLVAVLSVVAVQPAMAQAPTDELPAQTPEAAPDQNVTVITIVRLEDLPPQLKTAVETKLHETSATICASCRHRSRHRRQR